jgi:hypothetical protein
MLSDRSVGPDSELAVESADGERLPYAKPRQRGLFARALAGAPGVNREEQFVDDYVPALGGIAPMFDGFFYLTVGPDGPPRAFCFFDYTRPPPALVRALRVIGAGPASRSPPAAAAPQASPRARHLEFRRLNSAHAEASFARSAHLLKQAKPTAAVNVSTAGRSYSARSVSIGSIAAARRAGT